MRVANVPAASGYQLGAFKPVAKRNGNIIEITGREFGCSVNVVNTSSFGVAGVVPMTPALFQSATLGAHAKCHEKYRFKSIVIHYVPAVPTSAQGQVLMLSSKNLNAPFINSAASTFLARGLTQENAILTPIWMGASTSLTCDSAWRNVDFITDPDIEDNIIEELQVYGWSDTTLQAGSIIFDFIIEFKDPVYQPHAASIPDPLGPCTFVTAVDNSAVNAVNDVITLTASTLTAYANGSIFRLIFRQSASTLPTGVAAWSSLASVGTQYADTLTAYLNATSTIAMAEGTTLYGLVVGANLVLYNSIAACRGGTSGKIVYQTATTAVGSYLFLAHVVAIGNAYVTTTQ